MAKKFAKYDIARDYVRQFPNTAKLAISRMIVRDHPAFFTLPQARLAVNYVTGTAGKQNRAECANTEDFREGKKLDLSLLLPDGITSFKDWAVVKIATEARALILPDMHVPYHDTVALQLAIDFGVKRNPTHVILNGDLGDFFSVSFWQKDPRLRNLKNEIETVRAVLKYLRAKFPNAIIILKEGNHEERWERYLAVKAPELLGVEDFELRQVWRLDEMGIQIVSEMRPLKLGRLFIVHGHEFKWGITNPVNPARGFFMRAQDHCLGSHLHRTSSHSEKSIDDSVTSTWSTGCLCDLHPDYSPINKWNHGFAFVETDAKGHFQVDNRKIIDGNVYGD